MSPPRTSASPELGREVGEWLPATASALLLVSAAAAALSGSDERRVRLGPLSTSSTCPFRLLTGRRCPGCGMTRALALLMRGRPVRATRTHPAAIPLAAVLVYELRGLGWPRRPRAALA